MYKISVITPKFKNDYLTDTVIDGLLVLQNEGVLSFKIPNGYSTPLYVGESILNEKDFVDFSSTADLIIFCWGKDNTNYDLADRVNRYDVTVFVDGSEIGGNGRLENKIQQGILDGTYNGRGAIDVDMEKKCAMYFRREEPYVRDIIPLPFGIQRKYTNFYSDDIQKDIDFFCVFGQDEYPPLRREVSEALVEFCDKNGFTYCVEKMDSVNFYKKLARSKVGVSVSGGGYDTARFWEILGNNCILLTEKIDLYKKDDHRFDYDRIWQFSCLEDFCLKLEKLGDFLKNQYKKEQMPHEYQDILTGHSSKSRVLEILEKARNKGIIQ